MHKLAIGKIVSCETFLVGSFMYNYKPAITPTLSPRERGGGIVN
jgi:hypothetical protein